jgi:putative two-component system response regulator
MKVKDDDAYPTKEGATLDALLQADYEKEIQAPLTDSLTGLLTHGIFQICLDREIKRSQRHGTPFTLALIDIDWFSAFNRRNGSLEGDRVLKDVATLIRANIREADVAARFLGDVYAVLFIMAETEPARIAAERIRNTVAQTTEGKLSVSIGLASFHRKATSGSLLRKARQSLTQAKIRGKNRVYAFEQEQPVADDTRPTVLVVDDEELNVKQLEALLLGLAYQVIKASSGEEALHAVEKEDVDLILLDIMLPDMDGYKLCRRLKSNDLTRIIPIIMLTALSGTEAKVKGIEAGADDFLTKPPGKTELLARTKSLIRVKTLNDNLVHIEALLFSLANAIEARDLYTEGHVQRVAQLALALGARLKLSGRDLRALKLGGVLHDIGKLRVPDTLLNKPGPLTPEEREIIETHASAGHQICLPLGKTLGATLEVIRCHHERLDGSGYPDGLKGEEIPLVARIMAVVDIYDALVTDRPYREAMGKAEALKIIGSMVGAGKLDREVVRQLEQILDREAGNDRRMRPHHRHA